MFDLARSIGAGVLITHPTAASYITESSLLRKCEQATRAKHVLNGGLNGSTMVPLVVTMVGELDPSAEAYLHSLSD